MQVAKWGNSLAVRIPQAVVEALKLKEGDQIEITIARDTAIRNWPRSKARRSSQAVACAEVAAAGRFQIRSRGSE